MRNCTAYKERFMGTLKLIFDFKFPLPPSLFVIKKEPERGAAQQPTINLRFIYWPHSRLQGDHKSSLADFLFYYIFGLVGWTGSVSCSTIYYYSKRSCLLASQGLFVLGQQQQKTRRRTHAKQYRDIKLYDNYQMGSTFHPNPKTKLSYQGGKIQYIYRCRRRAAYQ